MNDYARYIGAPVLHPLVSIIHYDELTTLRHSLNSYDVYGMFLNDGVLPELTDAVAYIPQIQSISLLLRKDMD